MNIDTGELRRITKNLSEEERRKLSDEGFVEVPANFKDEALRALIGNDTIMVDMEKKTPLTAWAKRIRQGRNEKCSCGSSLKYKNCCGKQR